jgi:hypothetical protein
LGAVSFIAYGFAALIIVVALSLIWAFSASIDPAIFVIVGFAALCGLVGLGFHWISKQ